MSTSSPNSKRSGPAADHDHDIDQDPDRCREAPSSPPKSPAPNPSLSISVQGAAADSDRERDSRSEAPDSNAAASGSPAPTSTCVAIPGAGARPRAEGQDREGEAAGDVDAAAGRDAASSAPAPNRAVHVRDPNAKPAPVELSDKFGPKQPVVFVMGGARQLPAFVGCSSNLKRKFAELRGSGLFEMARGPIKIRAVAHGFPNETVAKAFKLLLEDRARNGGLAKKLKVMTALGAEFSAPSCGNGPDVRKIEGTCACACSIQVETEAAAGSES
eukprot:tig00000526_g1900.t1